MAGNIDPIFSKAGILSWIGAITAANMTTDMTSGTTYLVATGDAEGNFIQRLRIKPLGTNVATVMRVWVNNGSTTGTAANNMWLGDITCPATTASNTAAIPEFDYALNMVLPSGYKIYVTIATGVAAGFGVCAIGGKY